MAGDVSMRWGPGRPLPLVQILGPLRRGAGDPTHRVDGAGRHWRGLRTPVGPATLMIHPVTPDEVHAAAWGAGAEWALASVPGLLGADDDVSDFEPNHPLVAEGWRRHPHLRIGRTGLVMEALVPSIIEQKVTGQEAFAGFRALVHRFGERAPGPGVEQKVWLQPTPEQLALIPSWEWLRLHIDPARSKPIAQAARVASAIERIATVDNIEADRRLQSLPGVGIWTSAEVRATALGDPDAVSFGDYHVANQVGWAMLGHDISDDEMATLLEPWRGHRGRVVRLVLLVGCDRPRHGPRMAPRRHLPK